MFKRLWMFALSGVLGVGFLVIAPSAWADFTVTCTPSGPVGAQPGCIPAGAGFPNSWFISAGAENAVVAEQTMTLLFAGGKFGENDLLGGSAYGVFNIIDEGIGVNKISDQIQLVNGGAAGDKLVFSSDVSAIVPGGVFLAKESGTGIIVDLPLGLTDGNFAKLGFDTEFAFNPLGFPGVSDTSDFVSVVPEPSTLGLLGPSLAGLMMVMYRSKKRKELVA